MRLIFWKLCRSPLSSPVLSPVGDLISTTNWLLALGIWSDAGQWIDSESWEDEA